METPLPDGPKIPRIGQRSCNTGCLEVLEIRADRRFKFRRIEDTFRVAMQSPYSRRTGFQKKRVWAPKVWLGAELRGWFRLLRNNRSALDWKYSHWLVFITFAASLHTALSHLQKLIWGRRIEDTRLPADPLFIIGHWRTGTTWLHELLCLDDQFTFPTTYECFDPNHFLLTERFGSRLLSILMPSRRPMDAMPMAFDGLRATRMTSARAVCASNWTKR